MGLQCTDRFRPSMGPSSVWYIACLLLSWCYLLHFAELVQWGTGCSWVGCCSRGGGGEENIFVFLDYLEVFLLLLLCRVRQRSHRLVGQSASQLQNYSWFLWLCFVVDSLFEQSFQCIPYWLGTFVVASARRCFPSKVAGNGIFLLHHRCRECVWARIRRLIELSSSTLAQSHRRHRRFCTIPYDSMWVLNSLNGWLWWVALTT